MVRRGHKLGGGASRSSHRTPTPVQIGTLGAVAQLI
jgi:hypothetical protein